MKVTIAIPTIIISLLLLIISPPPAMAANLDFSIYPTLVKATIKPGKSISQAVLITNNGATPHTFVVRIIPFVPIDNQGHPDLQPNFNPPWLNYFSLANATIFFNKPFTISAGKSQQLTLAITVPEDAPLADYYATLLAISSDQLEEGVEIPNTLVSGALGMNLLLTTSNQEFPKTSLSISHFAPTTPPIFSLSGDTMFYDSMTTLEFKALAKNIGNHLTEPRGFFEVAKNSTPISLQPLLPQNILAKSERELQASPSGKFVYTPSITDMGSFTANFYLNSEAASASSHYTFFLFPFKASLALLSGLIILFILLRITQK